MYADVRYKVFFIRFVFVLGFVKVCFVFSVVFSFAVTVCFLVSFLKVKILIYNKMLHIFSDSFETTTKNEKKNGHRRTIALFTIFKNISNANHFNNIFKTYFTHKTNIFHLNPAQKHKKHGHRQLHFKNLFKYFSFQC